MTILSVAQQVALYVGISQPDALMSSTERKFIELREVLREVSKEIADAHDWELLTTLQTETGDGAASAFNLPSDFNRFTRGQQIWSSRLQYALREIRDPDAWLEVQIRDYDYVSGVWIKIGGQIQIRPTPAVGEEIKYYYLTSNIVAPASGSNKANFTLDTDSFRLDERVLKLGAIARWRALKQLPYDDDNAAYVYALSQAIDGDFGSNVFEIGPRRRVRGARRAYPEALS